MLTSAGQTNAGLNRSRNTPVSHPVTITRTAAVSVSSRRRQCSSDPPSLGTTGASEPHWARPGRRPVVVNGAACRRRRPVPARPPSSRRVAPDGRQRRERRASPDVFHKLSRPLIDCWDEQTAVRKAVSWHRAEWRAPVTETIHRSGPAACRAVLPFPIPTLSDLLTNRTVPWEQPHGVFLRMWLSCSPSRYEKDMC